MIDLDANKYDLDYSFGHLVNNVSLLDASYV